MKSTILISAILSPWLVSPTISAKADHSLLYCHRLKPVAINKSSSVIIYLRLQPEDQRISSIGFSQTFPPWQGLHSLALRLHETPALKSAAQLIRHFFSAVSRHWRARCNGISNLV